MENKNSYFFLDLPISENLIDTNYLDKLNNSIDLIYVSMSVGEEFYQARKNDDSRIICIFRTTIRKRKGQLDKFCRKHLPVDQKYIIEGVSKSVAKNEIKRIRQDRTYRLIDDYVKPSSILASYNGKDLDIFKKKANWYPWQLKIWNLLFDKSGNFLESDDRKIVHLVDLSGNSGKSSFFKYLLLCYNNSIGRIGYGTSQQLRSSFINIGEKKLYIIDLSRSKGYADREQDLLSVIEDVKTGLVSNAMYGSGVNLLMPPPHIIISSNYVFDINLLSLDRWQVYEIKPDDKDLGEENRILFESDAYRKHFKN